MRTSLQKNSKYIALGIGFVALGLIKLWASGGKAKNRKRMDNKVIIVTGSSEGIGKETALQLLKDGSTVIFACRDEKKTTQIIKNIKNEQERKNAIFIKLDLSSFQSVKNFVKEFMTKFNKLDILVNNAAIITNNFTTTEDNIETIFQVNTLSPIVLTDFLMPLIKESKGRIINVSAGAYQSCSKISSFYDKINVEENNFSETIFKNDFNTRTQYAFSKLGNIYHAKYLSKKFKKDNINEDVKAVSLHPGVILSTGLGKDYLHITLNVFSYLLYPITWWFTKSTNSGAMTTLYLCYLEQKEVESGAYYADCKVETLNKIAGNVEIEESYINFCKRAIHFHGSKNDITLKYI
jgi:retinol dehydrogenase-12